MITETSFVLGHWSVYDGRLDLASTDRVCLVEAFANVVRCRLEIEPHELSSIFAAPSDDAENDCLKDLVALQSQYFIDDFLSGVMTSFTRPLWRRRSCSHAGMYVGAGQLPAALRNRSAKP